MANPDRAVGGVRGHRSRPSLWPLGVVAALAAVLGNRAIAVDHDLERAHHGSPTFDVGLLQRGPVTTEVETFFRIARTAFQAHPLAAFSDLEDLPAAAERQGLTHLGGPLLGCLAPDGIRVWVRTLRPAQVEVAVVLPGGQERRFPAVASTVASDLTAVVPVTGLEPETRYPYRVLVDGHPIVQPAEAAFTTAPRPGAATRQRIAFGADCHKFGFWDRGLLAQMRARGDGALLLLGDLASDDRQQRVGLRRSDYLLRDLSPAWQAVAATMPVYATWDDHDYWGDDQSGIPPGATAADRAAVRTVWQQNWNNPGAGIPGRDEGIFFQARVGLCDLIMLDTRFFRTRPGEPDAFLGQDQMQWLAERLAACTGPFIILTSGTMWTDEVSHGKDSWGAWDPPARERILSLIEEKRIPGVLLLSGDRHGARVLRLPRPSGYTFYEFELGSLGGRAGPPAMGAHPARQPFGLVNTAAFGEFTVDTSGLEPTVTMGVIDADGKERFQLVLTRRQLTPGKP